jgi:Flp pilus assembly protein TadB
VVVLMSRCDDDAADPLTTDLLRVRIAAGDSVLGHGFDLSPRTRRALEVAAEVGAPVIDALDGALAAQEDASRARRAVAVASAQTKAVAAGLLAAPLLLVPGLGRLVGADLAGFYSSPTGVLVLAIGLGLLALGAGVIMVLVRRVGRAAGPVRSGGAAATAVALLAGLVAWWSIGPVAAPAAAVAGHRVASSRGSRLTWHADVDEAADLVAVALAGGVSAAEALRIAGGRLPALAPQLHRLAFDLELGVDAGHLAARAPGAVDPMGRLAVVLTATSAAGAPAAPMLRRLAADLRADDLARVLAAAERLPAQLTFPTALCLLPATVLLIGAPIVQAGLLAAGT